MSKSKDLLAGFKSDKKAYDFQGVVHYAGSEPRETKDGRVSTQFYVLVSDRDPKGAVLVLKTDEQLELRQNTLYHIEAEMKTRYPENHYGISIYWVDGLKNIEPIGFYKEQDLP